MHALVAGALGFPVMGISWEFMESEFLHTDYKTQMQWDKVSPMHALARDALATLLAHACFGCRRDGEFTGFPVMGISWEFMDSGQNFIVPP